MIAPSDIPPKFLSVRYVGARIPEADAPYDVSNGANCQLFAYALLAHFGRDVPPLRSSELWEDADATDRVTGAYQPLDLLLFSESDSAWGAHVAVALGTDRAIHLSQRVGLPAIWPLSRFHEEADYRVLLGAKRPRPVPTRPLSGGLKLPG